MDATRFGNVAVRLQGAAEESGEARRAILHFKIHTQSLGHVDVAERRDGTIEAEFDLNALRTVLRILRTNDTVSFRYDLQQQQADVFAPLRPVGT